MKRLLCSILFLLCVTACNQNIERVSDGRRLEDMPPVAEPGARPFAPELDAAEAGDGGESEVPPFVKAFFMHTWVESLYSPPPNRNPNPDWVSPLIDPVNNRVWCTDCHVSGQINFENIPKMRAPMVDALEDDREFMADLMRKWVARLNSDEFFARAKLTGTVTCLTCHATNPAP